MNTFSKISILLIFSSLVFLNCISINDKYINDSYEIINISLERAKNGRDSIHVIDWETKKDFKNNHKNYKYKSFAILQLRNELKEEHLSNLKSFFNNNNIDIEKELPYFEKQLKEPIALNRDKIILKEFRVFPIGTDAYQLKYNYDFTNYYFSLMRPVFTQDGESAILHYISLGDGHYFVIFKKVDGKWIEHAKYQFAIS